MNCSDLRAWLIETEALREASQPDAVREHLAGCPQCAERFGGLEVAFQELAVQLDRDAAAFGEERAVRLARLGREKKAAGKGVYGWVDRRRWWQRRWTRLGPLAVAAAAAAVLLFRGPEDQMAPPELAPPTLTESTAAEFTVEASEGGVAVFRTRNPKIHVVWQYETRVKSQEREST